MGFILDLLIFFEGQNERRLTCTRMSKNFVVTCIRLSKYLENYSKKESECEIGRKPVYCGWHLLNIVEILQFKVMFFFSTHGEFHVRCLFVIEKNLKDFKVYTLYTVFGQTRTKEFILSVVNCD